MRTTPLLILFACAAVNAQIELPDPLSGTYTVDAKGTGKRAFRDLATASRYISLVGVSGPVELRVSPGEYEGALTFFPVPGLKDDQKVVIRSIGQGEVKVSAEGSIVSFNEGAKNIVLDGITFGESGNAPTIMAGTRVSDIEIRNCRFSEETGGNRIIEIQGKQNSRRWNIHHNKFEMSNRSGYGIYTQSTYQLHIHHNEFVCQDAREPISIWNANKSESRVHDNIFRGRITGCAMRLDVSGHDVAVFNNLFLLELRNGNDAIIRSQGLRNGAHNRIRHNVFIIRGAGNAVKTRGPIGLDHNLYAVQEGGIGMTNNEVRESLKDWQEAVAEGFAVDEQADQNSAVATKRFFEKYERLIAFFHVFEDDDETAKPKAREELDTKSEIRFLIQVLGEDDPVAVRLALARLARHGRRAIAAVPALGRLCSHRHASIRADAAEALGRIKIGAEIVIPELFKLLGDEDERVLLAVVGTLGRFEHLAAEAAPRLAALARHELESVQVAAAAARKAVLGEKPKKQ